MTKKLRVVIAEDHTILREGLRALLSSTPEFCEVIGEALDGMDAIRTVNKLRPDLILLDLSMPRLNGLDAIREIKRQCPEVKVLVLTAHKTEEYIHETFKAGADGYCLKDATHSELLVAMQSVASGKAYISPEISKQVLTAYLESRSTTRGESPWDSLTPRERGVLKLIAEGYKNREIADYLCISVATVDTHRVNIMKKLDLHNTAALTTYAIERGIVNK